MLLNKSALLLLIALTPSSAVLPNCRHPVNWSRKECKNIPRDPETKIVGGENAPLDEYPWFAKADWIGCGGMLVTKEFVLSAAHCMDSGELNGGWQIGAFKKPYLPGNNGNQFMEVRDNVGVYVHPDYDAQTSSNDFALLKLDSPVETIEPVAMDQNQYAPEYVDGKRGLWAIGLGTLFFLGPAPDRLKHVELAYIPQDVCNDNYDGDIDESMICAADPGQDSCQGDSGGPLYDKANDAVVGVVSWGIGCAFDGYPGVYSRVADGWDWIQETICLYSEEPPDFCEGLCTNADANWNFQFRTDNFGSEFSWQLGKLDDEGSFPYALVDQVGFETYASDQVYDLYKCLPEDECYIMRVLDSYGDGMCCEYGNGGYRLFYNDDLITQSTFNGVSSEITPHFGNCEA